MLDDRYDFDDEDDDLVDDTDTYQEPCPVCGEPDTLWFMETEDGIAWGCDACGIESDDSESPATMRLRIENQQLHEELQRAHQRINKLCVYLMMAGWRPLPDTDDEVQQ